MPERLVWWLDGVGRDRVKFTSPYLRMESFVLALRARGPKAYAAVPNRQLGHWFARWDWFDRPGQIAAHSKKAWPTAATARHLRVQLKRGESSSQVCPTLLPESRSPFGTRTTATALHPERNSPRSRRVLLDLRAMPHATASGANRRRAGLARSPPEDRGPEKSQPNRRANDGRNGRTRPRTPTKISGPRAV